MVRILVADDHRTVRLALSELIEQADKNWKICGQAGDGKTAVEKALELKPDLVVLDFALPDFDGISAGQQIRALSPNTSVLLYTFIVTPQLEALVKASRFQGAIQKPDTRGLIAEIRRVSFSLAATQKSDQSPA